MIIIFSRSKELNGIGEIKRALPAIDPGFVPIGDFFALVGMLLRNKGRVRAIFTLSSSDLLLAVATTRALGISVKQITGAYHFKQWDVMLDSKYSAGRAKAFGKLMRTFPAQNLIFVSEFTSKASGARIPLNGSPNVIVMPVIRPERTDPYRAVGEDGLVEVLTIGRFVDFKTSSILQMMRVIDDINRDTGGTIRYTVYGEGPCGDELAQARRWLNMPELISVKGRVPREELRRIVSGSQIFFGMGIAVIQAAMLKVPSLIAVAYENAPITHGWFSEHDHEASPAFGDPSPSLRCGTIKAYIEGFMTASPSERAAIGLACAQAALPYEGEQVAKRIKEVAVAALPHDESAVGLLDVLRIRLETYWARFVGKKGIQA